MSDPTQAQTDALTEVIEQFYERWVDPDHGWASSEMAVFILTAGYLPAVTADHPTEPSESNR